MPGREPLQLAFQIETGISNRFQERRLADLVEHGEARSAHQGIAVEGAALVAMLEAGSLFRREQGGQRHAAADALAEGHDVGNDRRMFIGEQLAGAAHAGLDLVDDEQEAVLICQSPQLPEELIGRSPHAGLALDRLQHHCDGLV